jgi:hypothetical protein
MAQKKAGFFLPHLPEPAPENFPWAVQGGVSSLPAASRPVLPPPLPRIPRIVRIERRMARGSVRPMQQDVPTAMREPLCRPPASKIEKALGGWFG